MKQPFRVLSLDGGGMRGLYTASLLNYVAGRLYKGSGTPDIGKGFHLIVGTSTGGILTCGLAWGLAISRIIGLYRQYGPAIFVDPVPDGFRRYLWAIKNAKKSANNHRVLKKALEELFGTQTISQVYEKRNIAFCIPSVKMLREEARVFKTGHNPEKTMDNNLSIVDVCSATSAAPIFFPLTKISLNDNVEGVYTDGGLWANNPVLVGLLEALSMTDVSDTIEIITIGTCGAPPGTSILPDQLNKGVFDWGMGTETLSVSMNAQASGANYMAKLFSTELGRLGKIIRVIRVPQGPVSAKHIKLLQMDLASEAAIQCFTELGESDAIAFLRQCQDPANVEGQLLKNIFENLPPLADA